MALNYERVGWENAPSTATPIDAGSLNHMDNGILAVSNQYDVDVPHLQEQVAAIPAMLDSYLAEEIGTDVAAWLAEHVTPGGSTIVVDDTLSVSGAAADSKTVGDALNTKASQSDVEGLEQELTTKADAEDLNEAVGDISQLKNALTTKAEQDGAYPDLTAGQMLSKNEASDSVPYNFRAVGHDATLEYTDAIVGGTVAWNQLCGNDSVSISQNGISIAFDKTTYKTTVIVSENPTGFAQLRINAALSVYQGHKVLLMADKVLPNGFEFYSTRCQGGVRGAYPSPKNIVTIIEANNKQYNNILLFVGQSTTPGTYEHRFSYIDLTQMFGTTIADYINALETATSGAGVAWLRKRFPKMFTYQPYNAGEIVSVQGLSSHVTVGFNQWDEEWEVGTINNGTGQPIPSSINLRSKNFIPIMPSTTYYGLLTPNMWMTRFYYDENYNYLEPTQASLNGTFTTPINARYMRFRTESAKYPLPYNHDICINLSDPTRNGEYEPYQKRTYPLDDSLTLRGILKLDSNNRLYADGDRYLPDGTVVRRYGIVDLGTLNWGTTANSVFYAVVSGMKVTSLDADRLTGFICQQYANATSPTGGASMVDKTCFRNNGSFYIRDNAYTDAASFKAAVSGTYLLYEKATAETETADPYTIPQIVDPNGTEEYVSTSIVPVGHESRYPLDIAGRLDKILTMPTANGTYTLRATVNNGAVTYAWVST